MEITDTKNNNNNNNNNQDSSMDVTTSNDPLFLGPSVAFKIASNTITTDKNMNTCIKNTKGMTRNKTRKTIIRELQIDLTLQ